MQEEDLLNNFIQQITRYRQALERLPVGVSATHQALQAALDGVLPEDGEAPASALQALLRGAEKGLVHSTSPGYFGFVIGGSTPTSVAADWLTSLWDQNAQVYATSPAASVVEAIVARWLLDLLRLPPEAQVGFVTGAQMANFTALSVARNAVLEKHGWNVAANGLQGSPHIHVVCGECCHATVRTAIHWIGLGDKNIHRVPADREGRMTRQALQKALEACQGPTILCAQAGNVNTGAFDPLDEIAILARRQAAWLHIDGAFGLWAAASPRFNHLTAGAEQADSWATDAHKWLNVPYDSGIAIIRHTMAYQSLKTARCAYAGTAVGEQRDGSQWTPENSRRARGFVLYAALRNLGRQGVRQIVENGCEMAQSFATALSGLPYAHILNEVVLNQVLCRLEPESGIDTDAFNAAVARRLQEGGACWIGTTQWQGQTALRISVSHWATTREDVRRSVSEIQKAVKAEMDFQN